MSRINNMLADLAWKTHRWNYKFELFSMSIGNHEEFGFRMFTIQKGFRDHSLVSFYVALPNRTTRQVTVVQEWDILWSHHAMWKWYDRTTDNLMWSNNATPDRWTAVRLWILNKLFR